MLEKMSRKYLIYICKAVHRRQVEVLLDANTFIVGRHLEAPMEAPEDEAIIAVIGSRRVYITGTI